MRKALHADDNGFWRMRFSLTRLSPTTAEFSLSLGSPTRSTSSIPRVLKSGDNAKTLTDRLCSTMVLIASNASPKTPSPIRTSYRAIVEKEIRDVRSGLNRSPGMTRASTESTDHAPPSLPNSPLAKRPKTTMSPSATNEPTIHSPGVPKLSFSSPPPPLLVKKLSENATTPTRGSAFAAGYDLYSAHETAIPARGKALVDTDLAMAVPAGTCTEDFNPDIKRRC